ncbi:hypothetical protein DY000_02001045 [Brassica cretica]|uniref:RBR-type E3 ubiquitin transferase n=1 Tax=Brassica cretica TaxID=69181 RepID=A0ABQ7CGB3_BRACR|nr:hypothetical protein DY000_02001045 [Brassica cretica]
MWEQMIKEDSTPLNERVYCPFQSCSYLMSKTELSSSDEYALRRCFKCDGSFCLHCKVPWHSALSCNKYKKLYPNPQVDEDFAKLKSMAKRKGWRQCGKCKHMIERSIGCNMMRCRCGYEFCYACGKQWNSSSHYQCHPHIDQLGNKVPQAFPVWLLGL